MNMSKIENRKRRAVGHRFLSRLLAMAAALVVLTLSGWPAVAQLPEGEVVRDAQSDTAEEPASQATFVQASIPDEELARIQPIIEQQLELSATTLQQLNVPGVAITNGIAVTLDGQERILELYPHSMRSDDFMLMVQDETGALHEEIPPPIASYRGSVLGDMDSEVAASIIDGQLTATIITNGRAWAVQPVSTAVAGAAKELHAVFRVSDVIPTNGVCGVDDLAFTQQAQPQQGGVGNAELQGTGGRTEIAFDTDVEYYQANGSSVTRTLLDIEMIMNQVGLIYQNQVGVCFVIPRIIVRTAEPDPYSMFGSSNLLCQFRNKWNNDISTSRDLAHLMTGKNLTGSTIGVAWVGVVCNVSGFSSTIAGCGNTANLAYGLSQSFFSTNVVSRTGLTAHEIGHNFNACHCNNGGCPGTNPTCCTGGSSDGDCGIMWSAAGTQQSTLNFGNRSTNTIVAHRNSRNCLGSCQGIVYVNKSNNTGFEFGTLAFPFNTVDEGLDAVQVGGTVRIISGTYPEIMTVNKFVNVEASGGTVNIGN